MGTVIAVASGKGGTGKTTLTGGISACLAAEGRSVLCIDADAGLRNLDIALGMSDTANMSFYDVIAGRCAISDAAPHPEIPGLRLLTAPLGVTPGEIDPEGMAELVSTAREQFDFCFIDCPAGLGDGLRLSCACCDHLLIVATSDLASLRDAELTSRLLEELAPDAEQCLIVNRVQRRRLGRLGETIDDAVDSVALPLLGYVPEDETVSISANSGRALVLAGKNPAAEACLRISRRLRGLRVRLPMR